jgi:hypothetical protein
VAFEVQRTRSDRQLFRGVGAQASEFRGLSLVLLHRQEEALRPQVPHVGLVVEDDDNGVGRELEQVERTGRRRLLVGRFGGRREQGAEERGGEGETTAK